LEGMVNGTFIREHTAAPIKHIGPVDAGQR
jgi:hypothetical protein